MKRAIWRSTAIVALGAVAGRLLGVGREAVFAHYFGASRATDAYLVAVLIPYLIQNVVAGGSLQAAFVPLVAEEAAERGQAAAGRLVAELLLAVALALLVVAGGLALASEPVVRLTAGGFTPEAIALAATMLRWCTILIVLNGVLAVALGALNTFGEFGTTALLSPVLNGVQIVAIVALASTLGIRAAVVGLLLGTLAQCLQQAGPLRRAGVRLGFVKISPALLKRFLPNFVPAALASLVAQGNPLADKVIGSYLMPGSITQLNYADLFAGSVAIVTTSVALVTFPVMSTALAERDESRALHVLRQAVHVNLLTAVPLAILLGVFGPDIVRVVYGWGRLTPDGLAQVSRCVLAYSVGIPFIGLFYVLLRACYALKRPTFALLISVAHFVVHAAIGLILAPRFGAAGLAAGTSAGAVMTGLGGWFLLRSELLRRAGKDAIAWSVRLTAAAAAGVALPALALRPWGAQPVAAIDSVWRLPLVIVASLLVTVPLVRWIDPESRRLMEALWLRVSSRLRTI